MSGDLIKELDSFFGGCCPERSDILEAAAKGKSVTVPADKYVNLYRAYKEKQDV